MRGGAEVDSGQVGGARVRLAWRCGICGKIHHTRQKPYRCDCGNGARFYAMKVEDK